MIEEFLNLLGKGDLTVGQRDFAKSFCIMFPIVYCLEMDADKTFLAYDVLTRCMAVSTRTLNYQFFTILFLFFSLRLGKREHMRTDIGYYVIPFLAYVGFSTTGGDGNVSELDAVLRAYTPALGLVVCYDWLMAWAKKHDVNKARRDDGLQN